MHDTLLRVFVVAVGLLTCLRDEPSLQEWDSVSPEGLQEQDEVLLQGGEKIHQDLAPFSEKMTHNDSKGPQDGKENVDKGENQAEAVHMSALEDVAALLASQSDHEQEGRSEMDSETKGGEEVQSDGSFKDLNGPAGTQVQPEDEEQESPQSLAHTKTSEKETSEVTITDWEKDLLWFLWNTLSVLSFIRFLKKCLAKSHQSKQGETYMSPGAIDAAEVPLLDTNTLQKFHLKYVKVSSSEKWKEEFLEGFTNDLLEAMRTVCGKDGRMIIDDSKMVDACNIIIPLTPSDPCSFQCLLSDNRPSDLQPDLQVCGQIKLVESKVIQDGCPCQSPDADEDLVCLLHCEPQSVKTTVRDVCNGPLCVKNSPLLSKSQVSRWFQSTIKQAWAQISHKYEFELNIRYIDAPGALVVRFRSGKKINFSMNPVVRFNSDAHFYITPCSPPDLDTFWSLSLATYEDRFMEGISKRLPGNSCHSQTLEISYFLHKRQTALSGSTALKDFHFKTALMHLLLKTEPSQWRPNQVDRRVQDLLAFMGKSLQKKQLLHALIGNPLSQRVVELPVELSRAKAVNLFHPLVVHDCIYRNTEMHFREMLKNAHMLIHDYADECIDISKF